MSDEDKLPKLPGQYQSVPDIERSRESHELIKVFAGLGADDRRRVIEFAAEVARQFRRYQ